MLTTRLKSEMQPNNHHTITISNSKIILGISLLKVQKNHQVTLGVTAPTIGHFKRLLGEPTCSHTICLGDPRAGAQVETG